MLTPPATLTDGDLERVMARAWGVSVVSIDYRPVGFGSHHWVATDVQGYRHFVTADELRPESRAGHEISAGIGADLRQALSVAIDLHEFGCEFVVAPVRSDAGQPLARVDGYAVALYPFVEGRCFPFDERFAEPHRDQILEVVAALHQVPITSVHPPAVEDFVIPWLDDLEHSMHHDRAVDPSGPYAELVAELIIDHESAIDTTISRYRSLVDRCSDTARPSVITHGEIHPGNAILTPAGWVIVDWDTTMLAPPERDLWRLALGSRSILGTYADATGTTPVDWRIDLYAVRWDLAELASFAAEFRKPHQDTEDSRKALDGLRTVVGRLHG